MFSEKSESNMPIFRRFLLQRLSIGYEATTNLADDTNMLSDLSLDKRKGIDDDSLLADIEARMPSLPITYWNKNKEIFNSTQDCAKYPSIFDLEFDNTYWQTLKTLNGTFLLYGAYYDIRKTSLIGPAIRVIGMIDRSNPIVITYCQLWFNGQKDPLIVQSYEYKQIWKHEWGSNKQNNYKPYLISCQIPKLFHSIVPATVSIVQSKCDIATNNLKVIYNRPIDDNKKDFAVCVKGLDFLYDDLSVRLVEWIELLHLLGVSKIYFYKLHVHPNISKVLNHYEERGMIQVTPITLPGGQPNVPGLQHMYLKEKIVKKRLNELIPYNDCFYKNLYMYKFISLLDIDEVIMPKEDESWQSLMKRVLAEIRGLNYQQTYHSYYVRNVYFFDEYQTKYERYKDIPKYLHMLQHVHRAKIYTKPEHFVKSFHDPEHVLILHNHFPVACLGGPCRVYPISTDLAQLQHYRADCVSILKKNCSEFKENVIEDKTIWKFKHQLIDRSLETIKEVGFFRNSNYYHGR